MNHFAKNVGLRHLAICLASGSLLAACGGNSQDATSGTQLLANGEACNPAWVSTTVYREPTAVSYLGINYTANFYSVGKVPSTNSGTSKSAGQPWITGFTCGGTVTTTAATTTTTKAATTTTAAQTTTTVIVTTTTAQATTTTAAATTSTQATTSTTSTTTTTTSLSGSIKVSTSAALNTALAAAAPGQVIELVAVGNQTTLFSGINAITVSGTKAKPITLIGNSLTQVKAKNSGYGLWLNGANYWKLVGFTVAPGVSKGIVLDTSSFNVIDGITVDNVGDEAVHFRNNSTYNVLTNSTIKNTGRTGPDYGEAVYIGTATSNLTNKSVPDSSNYNCVNNNVLGPNVTAEATDIKEGSIGGAFINNKIYMDGMGDANHIVANSADSVIDLKGSDYLIANNQIFKTDAFPIDATTNQYIFDAFQTHVWQIGGVNYGMRNIFRNNTFNGNAPGYGVNVSEKVTQSNPAVYATTNTVVCDNNKFGAGANYVMGLSNYSTTPGANASCAPVAAQCPTAP